MKPNATKQKAKAVTAVEEQRVKNLNILLGNPLPTGKGTDGPFDRNAIAKAMNFTPANVTHWKIGVRAISENQARTLEEKIRLPEGVMDLPDLGGYRPGNVRRERYQKADDIAKAAQRRIRIKLEPTDFNKAIAFFYKELSEGRPITEEEADTLVRFLAG